MSPQTGWLLQEEVVPRLRAVIPHTVHCVGCEDAEELIQDATAMAASIFHKAEAAGKKVAASSVAYYSIQHCKSGRRSVGHSWADVHGTATQLHGKTRLHSMEEVVASDEETGGEIFTFNDVLSNEQEDPSRREDSKRDFRRDAVRGLGCEDGDAHHGLAGVFEPIALRAGSRARVAPHEL